LILGDYFLSEEEEMSNVTKKKKALDTDLLFNPVSDRISGLYNPASIFGLSAIPEALSSCNLGSFAMAAETLSSCNLGSFAMAAETLSSCNLGSFATAVETLSSYNSSLHAMAAEVAKSYNSSLYEMAAESLGSYNLGISAAAAEALRFSTFSSIAEISEALKDASPLHLSLFSEALKPTTICSSAAFGKENSLKITPVEEIEILSLNAEDPRQIFPNLTPNLERIGLEELDSKVQSDNEISNFEINSKAYKFLCNLETYLRHLITKRIIEPYEKNLESKIPQDTLSRWEERKKKDNSEEFNLIDYSDFTDLKKIFEKGRNRDLFKDLFNDEECKALITKLHELDPIRKKIAHFRPLTKKELNRLVLYHDDIFTIIKSRER
jgi:hypothetical protein